MGQVSAVLGSELRERYFLQKVELGRVRFGKVWRAVDRSSRDVVAVKQFATANLSRPGGLEARKEEIARQVVVMKSLFHMNIARLFDAFEDADNMYVVLEYCSGGDLGDKLRERGRSIAEPEVLDWMWQICSAVDCMHSQRICHRDIKPARFMCAEGGVLKLTDFDVATFLPPKKLFRKNFSTSAFMAPEQHRLPNHSRGYGFPADLWAVGISMFLFMSGGQHPFADDNGGLVKSKMLQGSVDFPSVPAALGLFSLCTRCTQSPPHTSQGAQSFCQRLIEPDTERRLSAASALMDPWLMKGRKAARVHLNDDSVPVRLGTHPGCRGTYYCSRWLGQDLTVKNRCGPDGGPQCPSCKRFELLSEASVNDDGVPVVLGIQKRHRGNYYCGRQLGTEVIPNSDGRCGPIGGPSCPSCWRFRALVLAGINDMGSSVWLSTDNGNDSVHYCGRMLEGGEVVDCPNGQCGPKDGPACASCKRFHVIWLARQSHGCEKDCCMDSDSSIRSV